MSIFFLGYSIGVTGITTVIKRLFNFEGLMVVGVSYYFLLIGVETMNAIQKAREKKEKQ